MQREMVYQAYGFESAVFDFLFGLPGMLSVQRMSDSQRDALDGIIEFGPASPLAQWTGGAGRAGIEVRFIANAQRAKQTLRDSLRRLAQVVGAYPSTLIVAVNVHVNEQLLLALPADILPQHLIILDRTRLVALAREFPTAAEQLVPFFDELSAPQARLADSSPTNLSVDVVLDRQGWARPNAVFVLPTSLEQHFQGAVADAYLSQFGPHRDALVTYITAGRPANFSPEAPYWVDLSKFPGSMLLTGKLIVATAMRPGYDPDPAAAAKAVVELALRQGVTRLVMSVLGASEMTSEAALRAMVPAIRRIAFAPTAPMLVEIAVTRPELETLGKKLLAEPISAPTPEILPRSLSDLVGKEEVVDALGVDYLAHGFARLLASEHAKLPLAIGLFGHWGSGKSYFMKLIQQHVKRISALEQSRGGRAYKVDVAHITFNAWHYMDADLWSSLALRIFEGVAARMEGRDEDQVDTQTVKRRQELMGKVEAKQRSSLEAQSAIEVAKQARLQAQALITESADKADQATTKLTLAPLLSLLPKSFEEAKVKSALAVLGVRDNGNLKQLQQALDGTRGAWTDVQALLPRQLRDLSTGWRISIAVGTALGLYWLCQWAPIQSGWRYAWDHLNVTVSSLLVAGGGGAAWVKTRVAKFREAVALARKVAPQLAAMKVKAKEYPEHAKALEALQDAEKKLGEAQRELSQSEREIVAAEEELRRVNTGGLIQEFLDKRRQDSRYRDRQGVVSVLRQDLELLLSELKATNDGTSTETPRVQRIILYIDDLDRCEPDRVVEVLQAVHLLLAFELFAVVVAVDPRWLERSLYRKYVPGYEQMPAEHLRATHFSPQNYLEKIFQIPFQVPVMMPDAYSGLINALVPKGGSRVGGVSGNASTAGTGGPTDSATTTPENGEETERTANAGGSKAGGGEAVRTQSVPPEPVALTEAEVKTLTALGPLIDTPRGAKRLVNVYTLFRMQISSDMLELYLKEREYRATALLIALDIGFPQVMPHLRAQLQSSGSDLITALGHVAKGMADTDTASACALAQARLQLLLSQDPVSDPTVLKWLPAVSRFSFHGMD